MEERIYRLVAKVLEIDPARVVPGFSRNHAASWDSLRHIQLVMELERDFGVTFDLDEIPTLTTVEAITDAVVRKTS